jgi:hypothetical protein
VPGCGEAWQRGLPVCCWSTPLQSACPVGRARTAWQPLTTVLPNDRTGCVYSYVVKGRKLTGSWAPCPGSVHVGSHFLVTYLPSDPTTSQPGDPAGAVLGGALFIVVVPVLFGVLVAFASRRRQLQSPAS